MTDILLSLRPPPNGFADASPRHNVAMKLAHAEITRLRARVAELEAAQQWQPIETAPKDGTWILIYEPNDYSPPFVHVVRWGLPEPGDLDETWVTMSLGPNPDTYNADGATHWMPLPATREAGENAANSRNSPEASTGTTRKA